MFLEHNKEKLVELFRDLELPTFRLGQVRRWVFSRKTPSFDEMTDLSKEHRLRLSEFFGPIYRGQELLRTSSPDSTEKLLLQWPDGERIECVLLRDDRNHRTGCISTQVGCAMGCVFCASGMDGFVRNLTCGEILEQILRLNALIPGGDRLTHLVVMGIGEPLLNLPALLSALDEATATDGLDMSVRRITISTVGIPDGIRRLAESATTGKAYKLAVSLHAPSDELRSKIVPQNKFSGVQRILEATDGYFRLTGRRVTFEYTLIGGVNDHPKHAVELVKLLRNRTAIVNVIPFNPIPKLDFQTPSRREVQRFVDQLESGGLQVKVRFRKGDGISAACGQLRRSVLTE